MASYRIQGSYFLFLLIQTLIWNPTLTSSFLYYLKSKDILWEQHRRRIIFSSIREKLHVQSSKRKPKGQREKGLDGFGGSRLFGLAEWRKEVQTRENNEKSNDGQGVNSLKNNNNSVLLLPFSTRDILIPIVGETRNLVLKEGRFLDLFQDCLDDYQSIVGMAIMGEDGLYSHCILCEIADFDVLSGYRGKVTVQVTLLAVGRARIENWIQMKPVLQASCIELIDYHPNNQTINTNYQKYDTEVSSLISQIESIIPDERQEKYAVLFKSALQNCKSTGQDDYSNDMVKENDKNLSDEKKSVSFDSEDVHNIRTSEEVFAASWAILSIISDRSSSLVQEAILATNVKDRLELALRELLNENLSRSDNSDDYITEDFLDDDYLGRNMKSFQ